MHSTRALVSRPLVKGAKHFGNLVKSCGMKQFQRSLPNPYRPGSDLQSRAYRRNQHNQGDEVSADVPNTRLDDTMYTPQLWRERQYQSTWNELVMEEEPQAEVEESRYQELVPRVPPAVPQRRPVNSTARLQRISVPVGEFVTKLVSDQKKRKMRHYEAEVLADRIENEVYRPA